MKKESQKPRLNLKNLTKAQKQKIVKGILIGLWILIIGLLAVVIYMISVDKDAFLIAIPGLYDTREYNTLTKQRNELTEQNGALKLRNDELSLSISQGTEANFALLYEQLNEYITNTLTIDENLATIVTLDEQLINLKLPASTLERLNTSYENDKAVYESLQMHYELLYAKLDYFELRKLEGVFDNCLLGIDFNTTDSNISQQMASCGTHLDTLLTALQKAEETYGVKFVNIGQYIAVTKEMVTAYANFYAAVAQEDYDKSKEYDRLYNEKEAELTNIDVTTVWFEYKELVLDPLEEASL